MVGLATARGAQYRLAAITIKAMTNAGMTGRSLTVDQLAERWQRTPRWVTQAARTGAIPGAWKLGHLWRFRLAEIEAYELAQQTPNIFALSPGAEARQRNLRQRGLQ